MNSLQMFSLKKLVHLTMVFKTFFLFLSLIFFINSQSNASIIYDKNNISISEIELNEYLSIYYDNYGETLTRSKAIKNIILSKKTIIFFQKNNPKFIEAIDLVIKSEYGLSVLENPTKRNFYRFFKIRNEFISEYFTYSFNLTDLKLAFTKIDILKLPISSNNCLTILKLVDVKNNDFFIQSLFELFKNKINNVKIKLESNIYNVCISGDNFKRIEGYIVNYIKDKTEDDFNKFIYGAKI